MRALIVIPARYGSSRFPGKPLAELLGKPMIQHVYERSSESTYADSVIVATDDARIAAAVKQFGGNVIMTSPNHPSGTDRMLEVASQLRADIYINVQGDEPLIRAEDIDRVAHALATDPSAKVATLCYPIGGRDALDANNVKVVTNHQGNALYFSRAPIPFPRDGEQQARYMKHVGVYGYRSEILLRYNQLPESELEEIEKLEQLRLLDADIPIKVVQTAPTGPGVDTPECLEKVRQYLLGDATA